MMRTRRVLTVVLTCCLFSAWTVPLSTAEGGREVVRISFTSQAQLEQLASRLDVLEVHRDEGYIVAFVSTRDRDWLTQAGFTAQSSPIPALQPDTLPGACYRTIDQLYAQLNQWATQYPNLADLRTIGQSYEKRDLKVMSLTNRSIGGDKPRFFLMANIHARELITNETAMAFIQKLLQDYGNDPDITWLLDYHEVDVLVSANPDGYIKNEVDPGQWWRKNTDPYVCSTSYGIDLNRNFNFKWGVDNNGSSSGPCAETYRGPAADSEPETQVVEGFVRSLFPDQRGPGESDAAPITTTGVLVTLHSYGKLVLWPWGWTYNSSPNAAQLQKLGQKLASFNGYTPQQATGLYPTNGTTDDWSYGELGIASYTFELGPETDWEGGFYPACSLYNDLIQPNLSSLLYAAKVARTPYLTPFGPDASNVTATLTLTSNATSLRVQATVSGASVISAAEAYVDTPPWAGGTPHPLTPASGTFVMNAEAVSGTIPSTGLLPGRHIVFVRGQDSAGYWGPVSAAFAAPISLPYSVSFPIISKP